MVTIGGRYVVEATLGRGGMGEVLRVRDNATGQHLALKRALDTEEAALLRFRREFHTMAGLAHPHIVEVKDYGVDGKTPYYTMELLDGEDLADLDVLPWQRATKLLRDVASALAFLHARRLLHRDLAPRNVRCTSDGRAKLIDFGVLATIGITGDVAGTPPFIAPEGLRGLALDHRYDLFGLGALAYRVLTGKHAFAARSLEHLETVWRQPPVKPGEIVADLPPALDELVLSLLAHDRMVRPTSAAEVIDRLTVIGALDRAVEATVTQSWISSAALVGRQREMKQIRQLVSRARSGEGRAVLIEAPSGIGKTRLLRELALEAQLSGMTVVRAAPASASGPYGVVHELARGLLANAPHAAERAARKHAPARAAMLARVITQLGPQLGVKPAAPIGDPAEDRMRLQHELANWLVDLAQLQPIALCIDDFQRCDEASAAVLAAIAHQADTRGLLIAGAVRSDEPVRAPAPLASLLDAGQRIRLRGLDEADVEELCRSMFGEVPHLPRLAHWMHRVAGGSPLHATEIARHLVDRGVIRYVEGWWVIPEELTELDLPHGLAAALDARMRALPASVRALGEVAAVYGGQISLALALELADTRDEDEVFRGLDRLAFDEVLAQAGDTWRFRHDGLREALLRGLSESRRRDLHRRVGTALAATAERGVEHDAEIGWHLRDGGEPQRGAVLLQRAGRALYAAQSFADCIAPLEAALAVHEQQRGSAKVRLELLHMLLMAGCMAERKTALRHADPCVRGYRYWAGMDVADRARKVIGRHLAVGLGLFWATVRWVFSAGRGPNPYAAFRTFFIVVGYAATMHSLSFDFEGTQAMIRLVEPIAIFKRRIPYAVYLLTKNTVHFPRGYVGIAQRGSRQILKILDSDRLTPISDIDRRTGRGGALYMLALGGVMNLDPTLSRDLEELRAIGLEFFDIGADQALVVFHRVRGEEETAVALAAKLEVRFVQLGSIWQMEAFMPVIASLAYAFVRDTLGLRRTIEQLAAMCTDGFGYQPILDLARGEYLRERGDLTGAAAILEPLAALGEFPMIQIGASCAFAETLLALGDHARARSVAATAVAVSTAPEVRNYHGEVRSLRALALAEAASGDVASAAARLDTAIEVAAERDSPLLSGCLHEARARVALFAGDPRSFDTHVTHTERLFRSTRNPVLIARAARLTETHPRRAVRLPTAGEQVTQATPRASRDISVVSLASVTTPAQHGRGSLAGCRGRQERAQLALQIVLEETRAAAGYLYLRRGSELELVAPLWGDEPPTQLARALARSIDAPDELATAVEATRGESLASRTILLALQGRAPIGGLLVIGGALPLVDPDPRLLDEIAHALFDAGDVTAP